MPERKLRCTQQVARCIRAWSGLPSGTALSFRTRCRALHHMRHMERAQYTRWSSVGPRTSIRSQAVFHSPIAECASLRPPPLQTENVMRQEPSKLTLLPFSASHRAERRCDAHNTTSTTGSAALPIDHVSATICIPQDAAGSTDFARANNIGSFTARAR